MTVFAECRSGCIGAVFVVELNEIYVGNFQAEFMKLIKKWSIEVVIFSIGEPVPVLVPPFFVRDNFVIF